MATTSNTIVFASPWNRMLDAEVRTRLPCPERLQEASQESRCHRPDVAYSTTQDGEMFLPSICLPPGCSSSSRPGKRLLVAARTRWGLPAVTRKLLPDFPRRRRTHTNLNWPSPTSFDHCRSSRTKHRITRPNGDPVSLTPADGDPSL